MLQKFPSTQFQASHPSVFTPRQLQQVLGAYAEGVLQKNWKDYTIMFEKGQTTFCVVQKGQGVIYSISCTQSKKGSNRYFRVFDGQKQICRSDNFIESLNIFRGIEGGGKRPAQTGAMKLIK